MDSGLLHKFNANPLVELTSGTISNNLMNELDDHDYESLPASFSTRTHMLAGAAAGILEHCVMYPVDSVKVLLKKNFTFILYYLKHFILI